MQLRKLFLMPEYERKTQDNAQKLKGILLYCFSPKKTIEQYQNELKTSQNLGKTIPQLKIMKKVQKLQNFTLKTRRNRRNNQCSSSENPVAKVHFEVSFPWKLEGT